MPNETWTPARLDKQGRHRGPRSTCCNASVKIAIRSASGFLRWGLWNGYDVVADGRFCHECEQQLEPPT